LIRSITDYAGSKIQLLVFGVHLVVAAGACVSVSALGLSFLMLLVPCFLNTQMSNFVTMAIIEAIRWFANTNFTIYLVKIS